MKSPLPSDKVPNAVREAVLLRVQGESWASIARRMGYASAESARNALMVKHRDMWTPIYEEARERLLDEVEAEALFIQRDLMRPAQGRDDKIRQAAAHSLLIHCARMRAQHIEVTGRMDMQHSGQVEHTHRLTLEERVALAEQRIRERLGTASSAPSDAGAENDGDNGHD